MELRELQLIHLKTFEASQLTQIQELPTDYWRTGNISEETYCTLLRIDTNYEESWLELSFETQLLKTYMSLCKRGSKRQIKSHGNVLTYLFFFMYINDFLKIHWGNSVFWQPMYQCYTFNNYWCIPRNLDWFLMIYSA